MSLTWVAMPPLHAVISVLVVLATGDPADGSTRTLEQALRVALGSAAVIVVRPAAAGATDESLAASAAAEHTTLVGVVSWSDHQRRATIHFVMPADGRWSDREIRFDAADAAAERGRTVGFALASMVPDEAMVSRESPPPEPLVAPAAPPAPATAALLTPSSTTDASSPELRAHRIGIDASALAATGLGGHGGGIGAMLGLRLPIAAAFAGRAALGVRAGEVGPAQATSRVISGGLGVAWQPWLDTQRRWAVGGRIDVLVLHQALSHFSSDDPEPVTRGRFLPGFDAALEGTYRFVDSAAVIAAAGAEAALGDTKVEVRGREVTSLPVARLFAEVGLRLLF